MNQEQVFKHFTNLFFFQTYWTAMSLCQRRTHQKESIHDTKGMCIYLEDGSMLLFPTQWRRTSSVKHFKTTVTSLKQTFAGHKKFVCVVSASQLKLCVNKYCYFDVCGLVVCMWPCTYLTMTRSVMFVNPFHVKGIGQTMRIHV